MKPMLNKATWAEICTRDDIVIAWAGCAGDGRAKKADVCAPGRPANCGFLGSACEVAWVFLRCTKSLPNKGLHSVCEITTDEGGCNMLIQLKAFVSKRYSYRTFRPAQPQCREWRK